MRISVAQEDDTGPSSKRLKHKNTATEEKGDGDAPTDTVFLMDGDLCNEELSYLRVLKHLLEYYALLVH